MHIILSKDYEDQTIVNYFFETKIAGDLVVTSTGKKRYELIKKIGYCSFNKSSQEFILDKNKTDEYFFQSEREAIKVFVKLIKFNELKEFPPITEIACC